MDVLIHNDFSSVNLDEMKDIYASVNWNNHSKSVIKRVFNSSNVVAFAMMNGQLIGFGRWGF